MCEYGSVYVFLFGLIFKDFEISFFFLIFFYISTILIFTDSENHKIIKLERDTSQSFGISIVGGKVNVAENVWITGIFIKDIVPNSPADLSKQLKVCVYMKLIFYLMYSAY